MIEHIIKTAKIMIIIGFERNAKICAAADTAAFETAATVLAVKLAVLYIALPPVFTTVPVVLIVLWVVFIDLLTVFTAFVPFFTP